MKLVPLYKGCQKGIHGQVVCVKADVDSTAKALPRLPTDGSLVRIKLKCKLQYKSHVIYRQVCPSKIRAALNLLKETNPVFQDIEIDTDELEAVQNDPIIANENDHQISDSEEEDNERHEAELVDTLHEQDAPQIFDSEMQDSDVQTHEAELIDTLHEQESSDTSNKETPEAQHGDDDDITNTSAPLMSFLQPVDFTQYIADHSDESMLVSRF